MVCVSHMGSFFFFNDTATTEIYTLSLHDALPISDVKSGRTRHASCGTHDEEIAKQNAGAIIANKSTPKARAGFTVDRKSTRLNSSHSQISYAVFCLKKKKNNYTTNLKTTVTTCAT